MIARRLITSLLVVFSAIVVSSFAYGVRLLVLTQRVSRGPASGASREARVAELLRRAEKERREGKVEQALVSYRRILVDGPSLPAQLGLAEGELLAGREEVASREFERVLELDPKHPRALLALARIEAGDARTWPRAEEHFRSYLAVRPDDAEAQLALARVLSWRGRSADAAAIYAREGVQRVMGEGDRRDQAFALAATGRAREAEPILRDVRARRPDDDDATRQLAAIHAARREWPQAIALYRALLVRRPEDAQAQLEYGHALMATGDAAAAVGPLARAARALPGSGEAGLAYARALRESGDRHAALREYERVLPQHARDAAVLRESADLLMDLGRQRQAARRYADAAALGLRDYRLLVAWAGALQASGKPAEAAPLMEEAYRLEPSDRLAFDLAKVYQRLGRNQDALRLLNRIEPAKVRPAG
jgi:tetratricopeptide (TPR) repeat protein